MKYREYKVLKVLKKYTDEKNGDNKSNIQILHEDFYSNVKYKKASVNVILKKLEDDGYIVDIFNKIPTTVHTVQITDEGQDILDNYYKNSLKSVLSKIIWMMIGSFITIFFQSILKII